MQIHIVQSGESLWRIAQSYGTDVSQIASVNDLQNPNVLTAGESLVIPESGVDYVVQPGDTLQTAADRLGVTVQQLASANQIADPSRIYAGQILRIPAALHPVIETFAFAPSLGDAGKSDVLRLGRHLSYLAPFTYRFTEDGELTDLEEKPVLQGAAETNTAPFLVVANQGSEGGFDSDLAAELLQDQEAQSQLIDDLLETMRSKGYAGVNFDFEYVNTEDRENYNTFLRRVVSRLHPAGFLVSTDLAPKQSGQQQGQLYGGIDYQTHGSICDFVILMTYEWGWAGGPPRAIAPIDEVRGVLDYAVRLIPRDKILMGISLYGRDWEIPWEEGTRATTLSPQALMRQAARYGVQIQYDNTSQAPFYRYTDDDGQRHEVWFEDARSMQAKYETVRAYGIRGAAFWTLNFSFPQNWAVLQSSFRVRQW